MNRAVVSAIFVIGIALVIWWIRRPIPCSPVGRVSEGGSWSMGTPMLTGRSEFAATVLDGHAYVSGGLSYRVLRGFERYSFAERKWKRLANLPRRLHHMGLASLDGKVYMAGGYTTLALDQPTDQAWVYSPEENRWQPIAPMPAKRAEHELVALGQRLYAVGGEGWMSERLFVYDPQQNEWTATAGPAATRNHLAAVAYRGKLYALGGRQYGRGELASAEVYDPTKERWTTLASMPAPRGGSSGGMLNGRLHVMGGESFRRSGSCTNPQHEAYDPAVDEWVVLPDMPVAKHGVAAVAYNDELHVFGGATRPNLWTVVTFTRSVQVYKNQ